MDVSQTFLRQLNDLYSEKYRLYDIWNATGDTGLHMVTAQCLTQRTTKPTLPIKNMLLSMYGIPPSQIFTDPDNLHAKGVIPRIVITPPDNKINESEEYAGPCWYIKEAPKKKGIFRRVMGFFTRCCRPKTK